MHTELLKLLEKETECYCGNSDLLKTRWKSELILFLQIVSFWPISQQLPPGLGEGVVSASMTGGPPPGSSASRGVYLLFRYWHLVATTSAVGTHPTGIHFSFVKILLKLQRKLHCHVTYCLHWSERQICSWSWNIIRLFGLIYRINMRIFQWLV